MAVMLLLAAAHVGFWGWGLALGLQSGIMDLTDGMALAAWLTVIGLWLVIVARLSRSGWLTGPGVVTQPWLWVPAPSVMLTLAGIFFLPVLREAWFEALQLLPAIAVPALNSLRILAIGTVVKAWRGLLPRRIGYGVGIPDLAFGIWSLGIAVSGGFTDPRVAVVWHLTGAMILMLMLPMVLTVLRPKRLDASGRGDARGILAFPLVLAPAGLASLFLILHALVLYAGWTGADSLRQAIAP
jgi:hypothetical protein